MGFSLIDIDPFATGNALGPADANKDGTPDAAQGGSGVKPYKVSDNPSTPEDPQGRDDIARGGNTSDWYLGGDPEYVGRMTNAYENQGFTGQDAQNALAAQSNAIGTGAQVQMQNIGNTAQQQAAQTQADLAATGHSAALHAAIGEKQLNRLGGNASEYGQEGGAALSDVGQGMVGQGQDFVSQGQDAQGRDIANVNFKSMNSNLNAAEPNYKAMNQNLSQSEVNLGQTNKAIANANVNYGAANQAYNQAAPELAAQNRSLTNASRLGGQLTGIEAQEGPSAAQAQLQSGLNQSEAANLAMARSGRGFGGGAGAMRTAIRANAAAGQNTANSAAALRAQENAAYRQRQAANLGTAAGIQQSNAGQQLGQQQLSSQVDLQRAAALQGQQDTAAQLNMQKAAQYQSGQALASQTNLAQSGQQLAQQQLSSQTNLSQAQAQLQQQQLQSQVALQEGAQNDAYTQALYGLGLQGQAQGGQLMGQGTQLGLQGQEMGINAANAGAQLAQTGYGQNIQAQTAGGQLGQQGIQNNLQANQAGAQLALGGAAQSSQQQAQGYGEAMGGLQASQAATQAQQQLNSAYEQSLLQKYGIDQGVAIQNQALTQQASQSDRDFAMGVVGTGISALGSLAAFSDRSMKEEIEPANKDVLLPESDSNFDPFSQGVGISGPNQAQGAASMSAANAASGAGAASYTHANPGALIKPDAAGKQSSTGQVTDQLKENFGSATGMNQIGDKFKAMNPPPPSPTNMIAQFGGGSQWNPYYVTSDEDEKSDIHEHTGALETIEDAEPYSFKYKNPDEAQAGPGTYYGIMAQDLEKTPAGRSTVKIGPNGKKMVDTSRLTMVNTAALNVMSKEFDQMRSELDSLKKKKVA